MTPGSKAVGAHQVVVVDDEEPDLTINLDEIVERHRQKSPAPVEAKEPKRTPEKRSERARTPFAGKISLMGRIKL